MAQEVAVQLGSGDIFACRRFEKEAERLIALLERLSYGVRMEMPQ